MGPRAFVAAAVLVLSVMVPTGAAGVASDGSVALTIIDAASPAAGQAVPLTICLDGTKLAQLTTGVRGGPFTVMPGAHLVEGFTANETCVGTPAVSTHVVIPVADQITVMVGMRVDGMQAVAYLDDPICTPRGETRVVVRNGGDTTATGTEPRLVGNPPGATTVEALTPTVGFAEQTVAVVPTGTFTDLAVTAGATMVQAFGTTDLTGGTVVEYYVYGGADGATGAFSFTRRVGVCATSPSTTTPSVTVPGGAPHGSNGGTSPAPTDPGAPGTSGPQAARPASPVRTHREPTYIG